MFLLNTSTLAQAAACDPPLTSHIVVSLLVLIPERPDLLRRWSLRFLYEDIGHMEGADGEQAGELLGPVINTAGISDSDPDWIFPSLRKTPPLGTDVQARLPQFLCAAGVSFASVSY